MSDLEQRLAEVRSKYGKKIIQTINQKSDCVVVPTDIYEFDKASEIGGFPLGKIIEIAGPPSSGKTTLAWQLAAAVQRKTNKKILFFDYEQAASKEWLKKLGVPLDHVLFALPEEAEGSLLSLEDGFEIMNKLLPGGDFCAVIWDSVAASNPKGLLNSVDEKGLEGRDVALTAAALTKGLAVYGPTYRKSMTTILFINHVRANLANMANPFMAKFADKESTPGGYAFKHHADMRIDLDPMDYIKKNAVNSDGKKIQVKIGQNVKIKFVKNRIGEPFGEDILVMRKGIGFDVISSTIKRAVANGVVIRKSTGPTYLKDDENVKAPSYEGFWNLVYANPTLLEALKSKLSGKEAKINNIDLTAATRELSIKELTGDDSIIDESESSVEIEMIKPTEEDNEIIAKEVEKVTTLDNLLEQKDENNSETVEKRKRGRPPKVKV